MGGLRYRHESSAMTPRKAGISPLRPSGGSRRPARPAEVVRLPASRAGAATTTATAPGPNGAKAAAPHPARPAVRAGHPAHPWPPHPWPEWPNRDRQRTSFRSCGRRANGPPARGVPSQPARRCLTPAYHVPARADPVRPGAGPFPLALSPGLSHGPRQGVPHGWVRPARTTGRRSGGPCLPAPRSRASGDTAHEIDCCRKIARR